MKTKLIILFLLALTTGVFAQEVQVTEGNLNNLPVREHTITLREATVNKAGKEVMGMTVNGTIPGPTLEFTEGEYAVIYVKNEILHLSNLGIHRNTSSLSNNLELIGIIRIRCYKNKVVYTVQL